MSKDLRVRIHEQSGGLADLSELWKTCLADCPEEQHLFSYEWFNSWISAYGADAPWSDRTCVVAVYDAQDKLRAAIPLIERKSFGLTFLSMPGFYQPFRGFPCVPEVADEATRIMVLAMLQDVGDWDVIRLGPWNVDSPERVAMMHAVQTESANSLILNRGRTIVHDLEGYRKLATPPKSIKRISTYRRKFLKLPGARIERYCSPDANTARELFKDLGTIERRSWLAREGGDLRFESEVDQEFWCALTEHCLTPGGHLDTWVAYLDDDPVGFRFVLSAGDTSFMIANQFAESAGKYRIGWVLYLENLDAVLDSKMKYIDLAPGNIEYKSRLGGEERGERADIIIFRDGLPGRILRSILGAAHRSQDWLDGRSWGRRFKARLPRI